ncbi:unnamed protein product, partial [Allacma fusca]
MQPNNEPARKLPRFAQDTQSMNRSGDGEGNEQVIMKLDYIKLQNDTILSLLKNLEKRIVAIERSKSTEVQLANLHSRQMSTSIPLGGQLHVLSNVVGHRQANIDPDGKCNDDKRDCDEFSHVNTADQMLLKAEWLMQVRETPSETEFNCRLCYDGVDKKCGSFKLKKDDPEKTEDRTRAFRNFKQTVRRHAITANHLSKLSAAMGEKTCIDPRNKQAGLILGTLTWSLVTKFKTINAYEQQVASFADL